MSDTHSRTSGPMLKEVYLDRSAPMSALPTSPEVEKLVRSSVFVDAAVIAEYTASLRAAQHAATRKAVLEEVVQTWQTVLVTAHDHDRFGRFLTQLAEASR